MATKYSKDGAFTDPVVRCDSCQRIIMVAKLKEMGACFCGSRKVKNLRGFTDAEERQMRAWGIDPDFLALFEMIPDQRGIGAC